jgi:hypothetical protein
MVDAWRRLPLSVSLRCRDDVVERGLRMGWVMPLRRAKLRPRKDACIILRADILIVINGNAALEVTEYAKLNSCASTRTWKVKIGLTFKAGAENVPGQPAPMRYDYSGLRQDLQGPASSLQSSGFMRRSLPVPSRLFDRMRTGSKRSFFSG